MLRVGPLWIIVFLFSISFLKGQDSADLEFLRKAMDKQADHESVSVKFRQVKNLPALNEPVQTSGHLWLAPGKSFRWEVGNPKTKSAIYDGMKVYLLEERRKTAEELSAKSRKVKPLLLMLGIGEDATFEAMMERFKVAGTNQVDEHFVVSMVPRSGKLRRAMKSLVMQVNTKTSFLERIEWEQKDGTTVTTEFSKPTLNEPLPAGVFEVDRSAYTWN